MFTVPKLRRFVLIFLIILGGSCGRPANDGRSPLRPIVTTKSPPATYQLADEACNGASPKTARVWGAQIWTWEDSQIKTSTARFNTLTSEASLVSDAISATSWRDVFERRCDIKNPTGPCINDDGSEKGWVLKSSGGGLRICEDDAKFPRRSYETVALTSHYVLEKAYQTYLSATNTTIGKIKLSILPHFIDYYANFYQAGQNKTLKTYVTGNLAYFPVGQMIAVFPEKAGSTSSTGSLWESEFVLAHEYSHHIDFARHGKTLAAAGLIWDPTLHGFRDLDATDQTKSKRARIRGAYAEAFADLLAYYTEGSNKSIRGVPEIQRTRDVTSDTFANGEAKKLTSTSLLELTDGLPSQEQSVNFSDIHIAGSVMAHAAYRVFETVLSANSSSPETDNLGYKMTLALGDALANSREDYTLSPLKVALEKAVEKGLGKGQDEIPLSLKQNLCKIVEDLIPAIPDLPFAESMSCERQA